MELRAYWKVLLRRWWLVAVPVLVVGAYAAVTYVPPAPGYQVVMRFAAGSRPAGLSVDYDRYYPWLTSEYIANGLADAAETGAFAEAVSARLGLNGYNIPHEAIQAAIVTDNAQSILVVYLNWPDAGQIVPVAKAIGAELAENGAAYYPQLTGLGPVLRLLDEPQPRRLAPGLRSQLMGPAVKVALAVIVGVALALLWHYLDPTVREATEVEELGVKVLTVLPRR